MCRVRRTSLLPDNPSSNPIQASRSADMSTKSVAGTSSTGNAGSTSGGTASPIAGKVGLKPRHTIDVRNTRSTNSPIHLNPRMTAPVNRNVFDYSGEGMQIRPTNSQGNDGENAKKMKKSDNSLQELIE